MTVRDVQLVRLGEVHVRLAVLAAGVRVIFVYYKVVISSEKLRIMIIIFRPKSPRHGLSNASAFADDGCGKRHSFHADGITCENDKSSNNNVIMYKPLLFVPMPF